MSPDASARSTPSSPPSVLAELRAEAAARAARDRRLALFRSAVEEPLRRIRAGWREAWRPLIDAVRAGDAPVALRALAAVTEAVRGLDRVRAVGWEWRYGAGSCGGGHGSAPPRAGAWSDELTPLPDRFRCYRHPLYRSMLPRPCRFALEALALGAEGRWAEAGEVVRHAQAPAAADWLPLIADVLLPPEEDETPPAWAGGLRLPPVTQDDPAERTADAVDALVFEVGRMRGSEYDPFRRAVRQRVLPSEADSTGVNGPAVEGVPAEDPPTPDAAGGPPRPTTTAGPDALPAQADAAPAATLVSTLRTESTRAEDPALLEASLLRKPAVTEILAVLRGADVPLTSDEIGRLTASQYDGSYVRKFTGPLRKLGYITYGKSRAFVIAPGR